MTGSPSAATFVPVLQKKYKKKCIPEQGFE
jgi:hypothetical protein